VQSIMIQGAWAQVLAAAGQVEGGNASSAVQVQSIWDFLMKGGPVIVPIAVCSLAALTVVVERLLVLQRKRVIPPDFLPGVRAAFAEGGGAATDYCAAHPSPLANIFHAGLKRRGASPERREKAIEEAGAREIFVLRRRLRLLAVVAALAPVLGLLGTVFGMINAFQTVALAGDALGKTELLAKGIYEALITTAAGLVLAIPALICHHALSARVDRLVHDMDRVTVDFFDELEAQTVGAATGAARIAPHQASREDNGETAGALVASRA